MAPSNGFYKIPINGAVSIIRCIINMFSIFFLIIKSLIVGWRQNIFEKKLFYLIEVVGIRVLASIDPSFEIDCITIGTWFCKSNSLSCFKVECLFDYYL